MAKSVTQHFSYWRQNWRQRDPQTSSKLKVTAVKLCHLISREADFCGLWTSDSHLIQRISTSVKLLFFFPESLHIFWWNYSKSIVATYKERISKKSCYCQDNYRLARVTKRSCQRHARSSLLSFCTIPDDSLEMWGETGKDLCVKLHNQS